jgi:hypothetical protein
VMLSHCPESMSRISSLEKSCANASAARFRCHRKTEVIRATFGGILQG